MERCIETSEGPIGLTHAADEMREEISRVRESVEASIKEAESLINGGGSYEALKEKASRAKSCLYWLAASGSLLAAIHKMDK